MLGLVTTVCAIALALVPAEDDPTKLLTFVKIVGMTLVTVGAGVALYVSAPGRHERQALLSSAREGKS